MQMALKEMEEAKQGEHEAKAIAEESKTTLENYEKNTKPWFEWYGVQKSATQFTDGGSSSCWRSRTIELSYKSRF